MSYYIRISPFASLITPYVHTIKSQRNFYKIKIITMYVVVVVFIQKLYEVYAKSNPKWKVALMLCAFIFTVNVSFKSSCCTQRCDLKFLTTGSLNRCSSERLKETIKRPKIIFSFQEKHSKVHNFFLGFKTSFQRNKINIQASEQGFKGSNKVIFILVS